MSTLKKLTIDLELGQTILVGHNNSPAKITKIEYHPRSGEVVLNTTRGPRPAFTFRLCATGHTDQGGDPADQYR